MQIFISSITKTFVDDLKKKVKTVTCVVTGNSKYYLKKPLSTRNRRSHDDDGKATVMFFGTTQEPKIHLLSSLLTGMSAAGRVFSPHREDWRQVEERIANLSPSCVAQGLGDFPVGEELQKLVTELSKSKSCNKFRR